MSAPLIDQWTEAIHREFPDHKDPKSGLSKDCESCRALAIRLLELQTDKLLEIDLIEYEEARQESRRELVMRRMN